MAGLSGCGRGPEVGTPVEERFQFGMNELAIYSFGPAYDALKPVVAELDEHSPLWEKASYALAVAAWHKTPATREGIEEAGKLLGELARRNPDSEYAAMAWLDLGRIAEVSDFIGDPPDPAAAEAYYRRVMEKFPRSDMSIRAALYLAEVLSQSLEPDQVREASALLAGVCAAQPDSRWIGLVAQYQAYLDAFYLDSPAEALRPYELARERGFARLAGNDQDLWQFALLAEEAGQDELSADLLIQLIKETPRSTYTRFAQNRLAVLAARHPNLQIVIPDRPSLRPAHSGSTSDPGSENPRSE